VVRLYPQALGSIFVTSYDSQALSNERTGLLCLLYMLLALASAIFLGSESLDTRDHILLSQI
jgi:hypothetical protein